MFFSIPERNGRRGQLRLATDVRRQARIEAMRGRRAGVVDFAALCERDVLWHELADALESIERVDQAELSAVEALLAAPQVERDYGVRARVRNAQIASVVRRVSATRGREARDQENNRPAPRVHPRRRAASGRGELGPLWR
jgi:hypothetical protein